MKKFASFASAALIALSMNGLAWAQDAPKVIRIAFSGAGTGGKPAASGTLLATAHQRGVLEREFEKDGIKIEWTFYVGAGPATNEALAARKVDFAQQGDLPMIVGRSNGLRTKIILRREAFGKTYVVVPTASAAKSVEDLKGKKWAVSKGTQSQIINARILGKYGLKPEDVRLIDLNGDSTRAALSTGNVDAAVYAGKDLVARGLVRRIVEIDDPKIIVPGNIWVTEEFEQKYPQLVQRFVNVLVENAVWASDEKNREEQFRLWTKSGSPYIDVKEDFEGDALRDRLNPLLDAYFYAYIQRSMDETKQFRFVRRDVPLEGWIEPKYLQAALKSQGLEGFWDEFDADGNRKPRTARPQP